MQKYIKIDGSEVRYFEDDVNVSDWIDLRFYRPMTTIEVDRHENPLKYMSQAERDLIKRSTMQALTKRQFALQLYSIKNEDGTSAYNTVMDLLKQDEIAMIEYESVSKIERLSPNVINITKLMKWDDDYVDEMWQKALAL